MSVKFITKVASEPDRSTAAARSDGRLKQSLLEALDLVCSADTQKIFFEKVTEKTETFSFSLILDR
jgi:hypothetical protein